MADNTAHSDWLDCNLLRGEDQAGGLGCDNRDSLSRYSQESEHAWRPRLRLIEPDGTIIDADSTADDAADAARAAAEAKAKAKKEAEEEARREAEEKARLQAEAKAKREAEERARKEAEAKAKREAEEKARLEAEAKAKAEAEEKARRAAEAKAKKEAEEKARRAAKEKARLKAEAEAKAKREAEERARKEAEAMAKAKREAEEKARLEAEAKAKAEAEEKARLEAEAKAKKEAEEKARREAEEKARLKAEAEAKAKREAEEQARKEAEAKAKREAEEKARLEAEAKAKAKAEAEEKARREAEAKAKKEAEEKARRAAEEKARLKAEAEAKAKREAEEQARKEAEAKAEREAEKKAAAEAKAKEKAAAKKAEKAASAQASEPAKVAQRDLKETYKRLIASTGPISLAQYMGESNAHYYASRDPLGDEGDFITAPEVSQMFGELIGLWFADLWVKMGQSDRIHYVELGPGRGTLSIDAMRTASRYGFDPVMHFVEGSPELRKIQKQAFPDVIHHDDLSTLPDDRPLLIVANEFFDALPIHQLVRSATGWHERMIGLDKDRLVFVAGEKPMDSVVPPSWKNAAQGTMIETSTAASALMGELSSRLANQGGAALIIDYGPFEARAGSTLQALKDHKHVDPLTHPGEADLTAHVDFELLQQVAEKHGADVMGVEMQGDWLRQMGIVTRAEALQRKDPSQADVIERQLGRLINDDQMGTLFKVLGVCGRRWPIGFGFD